MGLLDDLDGATDAEIQRLMGVVTGERGPQVSPAVTGTRKLGKGVGRVRKWPWEPHFDGNLNAMVKIEVELPAYMVAAMNMGDGPDKEVREALRKHLDTEWAYPRFRAAMAAKVLNARGRFTSTFEA